MKKQVIRLTEQDLHRIIEDSVRNFLKECGAVAGGGATSCGNVMQVGANKQGDENPTAGYVADQPFGTDKETKKRSKDFGNGSMMMQKAPSQARK